MGILIFIVSGFAILIGLYILYRLIKYLKQDKISPDSTPPLWDDGGYMEKIGAICPTGWVYMGNKDNKYMCINKYNLPIGDEKKCYVSDPALNKVAYFNKIKDWQDFQTNSKNLALRNRCSWIKNCRPPIKTTDYQSCDIQNNEVNKDDNNPYYTWIGVADKC